MKLKSFSWSKDHETFSVKYPAEIVPLWFGDFYAQMIYAYYCSAKKVLTISANLLNEPLLNLMERYLTLNKIKYRVRGELQKKKITKFVYPKSDSIGIMFTSGKDSLHLLLKLIESHGAKKITAFYIKNINKSETHYEQQSVVEICKKLEIDLEMISASNSIVLNRSNHNIGLREQLLATCVVPFLIQRKISKLYFGLHESFKNINPPLYGSNEEAFGFWQKALAQYGLEIEIHGHVDSEKLNEYGITKEIISKHPDLLSLSSSCYTQLNFREYRHAQMAQKYPHLALYQGCGTCLKCLRINGTKLAMGLIGDVKEEKTALANYIINRFEQDYHMDHTLEEIVTDLRHTEM
jgi:hypothetical protein